MKKTFPEGFYWGAATASYQVEGGIENTDWAEAARQGRVPECGPACDHYNRYEADFDLAKELGHTAHRLSVEWARIEPVSGEFDEGEIAHYRLVLQALHARGLKPYITIWHFTQPLWFSESGSFERADAPAIFARYAAHVVEQLGDLCTEFSTMNEPNVFASNGWLRGSWPPFKRFLSIEAYENIHSAMPEASAPAILCSLMEDHDLAQSDLPEIGSQGVVSEILAGKRDLNVRQISQLAERFGVSPAVFMPISIKKTRKPLSTKTRKPYRR